MKKFYKENKQYIQINQFHFFVHLTFEKKICVFLLLFEKHTNTYKQESY
jgi:hypothetical protein